MEKSSEENANGQGMYQLRKIAQEMRGIKSCIERKFGDKPLLVEDYISPTILGYPNYKLDDLVDGIHSEISEEDRNKVIQYTR
jgi:hypothetical protein